MRHTILNLYQKFRNIGLEITGFAGNPSSETYFMFRLLGSPWTTLSIWPTVKGYCVAEKPACKLLGGMVWYWCSFKNGLIVKSADKKVCQSGILYGGGDNGKSCLESLLERKMLYKWQINISALWNSFLPKILFFFLPCSPGWLPCSCLFSASVSDVSMVRTQQSVSLNLLLLWNRIACQRWKENSLSSFDTKACWQKVLLKPQHFF